MRNIINYFVMKYKNSSLQVKLLVSYFILIFIPILVLSFFSVHKSTKVVTQQSMNISKLYLTQTQNLIVNELSKLSNVSYTLSQNSQIRSVLEKRGCYKDFSQEFDDIQEVSKIISNFNTLYNIHQIRLYIDDNFRYSKSNYITYNLEEIKDKSWYKEMVEKNLSQIILPPYTLNFPLSHKEDVISINTLIKNPNNVNDIIGVVMADILVSDLKQLMQTTDFTQDQKVFIVDKNCNLVCSLNDDSVFPKEEVRNIISSSKNASETSISGTSVISISNTIFDNWRLINISSFDKLLSESNKLKKQLVLFATLVGIIIYFMAYFYAHYNAKRIKVLADRIKKVEKGDLNVNCIVECEDEIGELQNSFNYMVKEIKNLLNERYNLGKNLKGMELKALQAQINPHFLYNTLDLISWKAKKSNSPEIVDIVIKLASYYQISLSNGNDLISLEKEIEHVKLYIELQNLRFNKTIIFTTDVDDDIKSYPIMKLILQPIVENSIAHGIMNLENKQGKIDITAKLVDKYIVIKVADNGVGIEKSQLINIISHNNMSTISTKQGGFGLLNIIDRLKIYYNNDYDFSITSEKNQGTTVEIKIPFSF